MYKPDKASNTFWQNAIVTRERREQLNGHKGVLLWFTGLSGSGKSTIAHSVEEKLFMKGCRTIVLDGDNIRHGLCGDLGFSPEDRSENLRRIGEVTKIFVETGTIVMTAFISPFVKDRNFVRDLIGRNDFNLIYCDCPLEVCEQRDKKGNYKRARKGLIENYTGISSPYEKPEANLILKTAETPLVDCVDQVVDLLENQCIICSDK